MIVCGTDFSENARQAAMAGAAIARQWKTGLKLVHVVDEWNAEPGNAREQSRIHDTLRLRLRDQAAEIEGRFGIAVEPVLVNGYACEKLIEIAMADRARLIAVSSLGAKKQYRWLLGSVAERVAQGSPIPVLIVRDSAGIIAWAGGDRALRVMAGVELGATSKSALRWAAGLRTIGPCELMVTHVAWPPGEHTRFGISRPLPLDCFRPELHEMLMRDLREWAGDISSDGATTFTVSPAWGRIDSDLAWLAADAKVDLLVVGTHQRAGSARFWQGSVSRGVLHQASCNVACIPRDETVEEAIPSFRHMLIPTDFSPMANRAIAVGYGAVAPGGVVHLLHVVTRKSEENVPDPEDRLRLLVPKGAASKGIVTEFEVLHEEDAWAGIWHAAGRLGVDAICMATHGRSGLSRIVLGSQAQQVLLRARQPVVLVPPERVDG